MGHTGGTMIFQCTHNFATLPVTLPVTTIGQAFSGTLPSDPHELQRCQEWRLRPRSAEMHNVLEFNSAPRLSGSTSNSKSWTGMLFALSTGFQRSSRFLALNVFPFPIGETGCVLRFPRFWQTSMQMNRQGAKTKRLHRHPADWLWVVTFYQMPLRRFTLIVRSGRFLGHGESTWSWRTGRESCDLCITCVPILLQWLQELKSMAVDIITLQEAGLVFIWMRLA